MSEIPVYFISSGRHFGDVDLAIVSHEGSGRTWLRVFLMYYIMAGLNEPVEIDQNDLIFPSESKHPRIAFSHTPDSMRSYKDIIFLARDPRDMMVSCYVKYTVGPDACFPKNVSFMAFLKDQAYGVENAVNQILFWLQKSPYVIKYEDLHSQPKTFIELIKITGMEFSPGTIERCRIECEFDKLKKRADDGELDKLKIEQKYRGGDPNNPESAKFRKGKIGGYVEYLSREDIEFIESEMKRLPLDFLGYEIGKN